jgi:uncharacterized protein YegL
MKRLEMVFVLDRSGSMGPMKNDTIGSFNNFIANQRSLVSDVSAKFTMIQFDTKYDVIVDGIDIADVPDLTNTTYQCGGWTALYDAIGKAIDTVGNRLTTDPDASNVKVVMVILTDGEENSSKEYNGNRVKEMIAHQESNYGWEFIYMSSSPDAFTDGNTIGLNNVIPCNLNTTCGISKSFNSINEMYCSYRT